MAVVAGLALGEAAAAQPCESDFEDMNAQLAAAGIWIQDGLKPMPNRAYMLIVKFKFDHMVRDTRVKR